MSRKKKTFCWCIESLLIKRQATSKLCLILVRDKLARARSTLNSYIFLLKGELHEDSSAASYCTADLPARIQPKLRAKNRQLANAGCSQGEGHRLRRFNAQVQGRIVVHGHRPGHRTHDARK